MAVVTTPLTRTVTAYAVVGGRKKNMSSLGSSISVTGYTAEKALAITTLAARLWNFDLSHLQSALTEELAEA